MTPHPSRTLAIDPGYERLGIAVIEKTGGRETLVYSDCFKTSAKLPFHDRLLLLGQQIETVTKEFSPSAFAIETLFFNTNQKTAMQVSEARGAVLYEAKRHSLEVFEYTPLQIKIAVTGYGRGDKTQVITMVQKLIHIEKEIRHDDEYDAIAVGLTHLASVKNIPPIG